MSAIEMESKGAPEPEIKEPIADKSDYAKSQETKTFGEELAYFFKHVENGEVHYCHNTSNSWGMFIFELYSSLLLM